MTGPQESTGIRMLDSREEITATDVTRSMKRLGFSHQEIYDTLTGVGIPGGEVQFLMDRIDDDFEDAELDSRTSRLAEEVEEIFSRELERSKVDLESKLQTLKRNLDDTSSDLERLEKRITELQGICESVSKKEK